MRLSFVFSLWPYIKSFKISVPSMHFFCNCFLLLFHSFLVLLCFCPLLKAQMYHRMYHSHQHVLPCLYCHPHSYIRMVQHLIERCLLLHMSQEQCIKALAEHARIRPLVTLTVWKELQKENRDFFRAYFQVIAPRPFMGRYLQRKPRLGRRKQWN